MKINIIGTVLAAALIALFSTAGFTGFTQSGTRIPGESYVVLPDENAEITRLVIRQSLETADGETQTAEQTETAAEVIPEKAEEQSMDDMLLMFWNGVVAVLIGELSALVVVAAWAAIKNR